MSSTALLQMESKPAEASSSSIGKDPVTSSNDGGTEPKRHPLGVRPAGNAMTSSENALQYIGMFKRLPDSLLLTLLEFLDQHSLVNLGSTCRGFYAYCSCDSLWRDIAVNTMSEEFCWRGCWRASVKRLPTARLAEVDCRYVFSDALHRPFLCSQIHLAPYISSIPRRNEIHRLEDLSPGEFNESWVDKPFILTTPVKNWQAYRTWTEQYLIAQYGDLSFVCESVNWPLKKYIDYMNNTHDESPIYLFDRGFVEKMGLQEDGKSSIIDDAYEPPVAFKEDFFMLFEEQRPVHRWLIIGPARSGSTFHKDPNATSAWNAVISGSKYWIMFPSSILPPGVYTSEDQSEVTSPLSIAEWLLSFHTEARMTPGCVEGVCHAGEILHIPGGWWHLVINLEPAIAITENFVPRAHVHSAAQFLKNKADQVSGFKADVKDAYSLFMDRLKEAHPLIAASIEDCTTRKRKWVDVVAGQEITGGEHRGFSFGFGDDIDAEEDFG